jgi:predicted nucleotidyltransferase
MNVLTAEQAEDLLSLQQAITELGVDLVVIGAVAYRASVSGTQRYTEDIDVALALDIDNFGVLEAELISRGWERDSSREQRWRGARKSRMDILPAGPKSRAVGQLTWPRSGMVMSLAGFDYVFECAVEIELAPRLRVKTVPPSVLFLLKVVAYMDDQQRRGKDLEDIHGLLRFYEHDSDRVFSDAVFAAELSDVEFAPAFLLGRDLALLCGDRERAILEQFVELVTDPESQAFTSLLRHEGLEPSEQRLLERLGALVKGFHPHRTKP